MSHTSVAIKATGISTADPGGADVPPPAPDVVPQPPTPPPPARPEPPQPDVIDPALPGEHAPVREPGRTPAPQSV